jgi:hypothetical protein
MDVKAPEGVGDWCTVLFEVMEFESVDGVAG